MQDTHTCTHTRKHTQKTVPVTYTHSKSSEHTHTHYKVLSHHPQIRRRLPFPIRGISGTIKPQVWRYSSLGRAEQSRTGWYSAARWLASGSALPHWSQISTRSEARLQRGSGSQLQMWRCSRAHKATLVTHTLFQTLLLSRRGFLPAEVIKVKWPPPIPVVCPSLLPPPTCLTSPPFHLADGGTCQKTRTWPSSLFTARWREQMNGKIANKESNKWKWKWRPLMEIRLIKSASLLRHPRSPFPASRRFEDWNSNSEPSEWIVEGLFKKKPP